MKRNPFAKKSGGARKGAGRPALSFVPVRLNLSLHPVTAKALDLMCGRFSGRLKLSRARLIDAMLKHCAQDHTFNPWTEIQGTYKPKNKKQ